MDRLVVLFEMHGERGWKYTASTECMGNKELAVLECERTYQGSTAYDVIEHKVLPCEPFVCYSCGVVYTEGLRVCSTDGCESNY